MLAQVDGRRFPRAPVTMSKTPVDVRRGPAALGQHTAEVLAQAGVSAERIAELAQRKVIA
jgi:crotonobetainyl-CoA:carnitine CoA-transferase CaiB-like acyl-CoA transferase